MRWLFVAVCGLLAVAGCITVLVLFLMFMAPIVGAVFSTII